MGTVGTVGSIRASGHQAEDDPFGGGIICWHCCGFCRKYENILKNAVQAPRSTTFSRSLFHCHTGHRALHLLRPAYFRTQFMGYPNGKKRTMDPGGYGMTICSQLITLNHC